jgi:uncharacterized membrane protein YvlD (DUF360 family)
MARGVKQFTIKETTKDETMEKTVEIKRNHLSILVIHYLQSGLSFFKLRSIVYKAVNLVLINRLLTPLF